MTRASRNRIVGRTRRASVLKARRLGIDTLQEAVVFMRQDCHVCRSEGFEAHARVELWHGSKSIVATLYKVAEGLLDPGEAGFSESAWKRLALRNGDEISARHPRTVDSLDNVRGKIYGKPLDDLGFSAIISDIVAGRYTDIHLSSFVTACSARPLDLDETTALTAAMIAAGNCLDWDKSPIVDKHCVGGLPGNRTTPIVVAIATACGLTMPKISSRAITSPAGTADTMETMAPVDLDIRRMRRVVEQEGGCVIAGGAVKVSPADDILIRIERALDLDSEGQLVASVLSKKIAAGSTHIVLDIPVGPTAKVRDAGAADRLSTMLNHVAGQFDLEVRILVTDGLQPVGRGIGPALEARDVLSVLQGEPSAPEDLRDRALSIAGSLLELAGASVKGKGESMAASVLENGSAWSKFQAICQAQGGMREPPRSSYRYAVAAKEAGRVMAIDNRRLARIAKLAGAPEAKAAGIEMQVRLGDAVSTGDPLFTIHSETPGELDYALEYSAARLDVVRLDRQ